MSAIGPIAETEPPRVEDNALHNRHESREVGLEKRKDADVIGDKYATFRVYAVEGALR
jgi:hypothetical protein